jgi:1,2-diacylglycerol-3-alpha-glucose alpha-1,2-galactosyltransferase
MYVIKMKSSAHKISGQGVASCYEEQVRLVRDGLRGKFDVRAENCGSLPAARPADINHYHTVDPHYFLQNLAFGNRSVSVGYVHFLPETVDDSLRIPAPFRQIFYKYLIAFYKSMDYLVVVNPVFIRKLESYGIDPARVRYIPNYVSCAGFAPLPPEETAWLKDRLGLSRDGFAVLGAGQLQRRKGIADFVEVARAMPDVQFIWAGGFSFGKMSSGYGEINAIFSRLPDNIRFLGIVGRDEMNALYNACDLLFLPSYSELFPMTVLEAMCCEKPLLLRDIEAYPPILHDCYLKGGTIGEFVSRIRALKGNDAEYARWQANSRRTLGLYGKERILKLWDAFYSDILEERGEGEGLMGKLGGMAGHGQTGRYEKHSAI